MKKSILKKLIAITLSLTLVFSCIAISAPHAHAATVEYYGTADEKTGIKAIVRDGVTYYDIYNQGGMKIDALNEVQLFQQALTAPAAYDEDGNPTEPSVLELWSNFAAKLFDSADPLGGMVAVNGVDVINFLSPTTSIADSALISVNAPQLLNATSASSVGKIMDSGTIGCVKSTGLTYVSSLSKAQSLMASELASSQVSGIQISDMTSAEILESLANDSNSEDAPDSAPGYRLLNDSNEQTVLTSIVSASVRDAVTMRTSMTSLGIAFYDFELVPLVGEDIDYVTAADGYESLQAAAADGAPGVTYNDTAAGKANTMYTSNPSMSEASVQVSYEESNSTTVSNSMESAKTFTYSESIGSSTSLSAGFPEVMDVEKTISLGFTAEQAISTAYGTEHSCSQSYTVSSTASVNLPAHTKIGITQQTGTTEVSLDYDCPVYITYKVAIFSMGRYLGQLGGGMCAVYGTDKSIGGYTAVDSLEKIVDNYNGANISGFERALKTTYIGCHISESQHAYEIPWSKVLSSLDTPIVSGGSVTTRDCIERLPTYIPLCSAGATISMTTSSINNNVSGILPLYDLDYVQADGSNVYTLAPGGTLDFSKIATAGYNAYDVPYYGYVSDGGEWVLCDEDGNELTAVDGVTMQTVSAYEKLTAQKVGTYYAKFKIDENSYDKADGSGKITNADLSSTAIVTINVTETGLDHVCAEGPWQTTIAPSCTSKGEQCACCVTCGRVMYTQTLEKTEHIPVTITTPATCTSEGSEKEICGKCLSLISSKVIDKLSHEFAYESITREPTCTAHGEKSLYCKHCNQVYATEQIEKSGHAAAWLTVKEADCKTTGREEYTCTICKAVLETREIAKTEHVPGGWEILQQPTCKVDGLKQQTCAICDALLGEPVTIPAHDHDEGAWRTVLNPTCTTDGERVKECTICKGTIDSEAIPKLGHDEGVWTTALEATCETQGERHKNCTRCAHLIDSERIDALGHTHGPEMTCVTDQVCLVCEEVLVPADGKSHVWTEWTVYKEAGFFTEEQQIRVCTSCDLEEYRFVKGSSGCHKYFPHCDGSGENCWACETLSNTNGFARNLGKFITWFFFENIITTILFPFAHGHFHEYVNLDSIFGS